jgi:hypothetical protein
MQQRQSARAHFLQVLPVLILAIGVLLPVEVRLNLAGQTVYGYRMAWMACAPWIISQILRGKFSFRFIDVMIIVAASWIALSFTVVEGVEKGLPAGAAFGLDVLLPYLISRQSIRNLNDFRFLLIVLAPILFGIAALMALESVSHVRFIRSGAQSVFGSLGAAEYGDVAFRSGGIDTRYGLMRAMGPFSHPILAGTFFAGILPLYYFSRLRGWPYFVGMAAGVGAAFSISSAAFLGVIVFVILAVVDRLRNLVTFFTWPMFLSIVAVLAAAAQALSPSGLIAVLIRLTVNPATGYYRMLIWEYGAKMVERRPIFGSGYASFEGLHWMGDSVDTIWLLLAIRNGLPAALLLGLAVVLAIIGLSLAASRTRLQDQTSLIGIAVSLSIFFLIGFTVSFFGGILIWFVMVLGVGVSLGQFRPVAARRPLPPRGRIVHTGPQ